MTQAVRQAVKQGPEDPWHVDELDLDRYLTRIGVVAKAPSRQALDELHEAHVRTFTFDNIDVLLGQHPGVALAQVQAKFAGRGRGGYCFEHATLFAAALERLGYQVQRRLGRVGDPTRAGRTHLVVVVTYDGQQLLADPGFGMSLLRPIPLEHDAQDEHRGWSYRVREARSSTGRSVWELHRLREAGWELMHTTDDLPVHPVDVAMGHHFTSTFPGIHFTQGLMLTAHGTDVHTTVTTDAVTVRRPGRPTEHRRLEDGELPRLLHELRVPLTAEEERRLTAVVTRLAAQSGAAG